MSKPLTAQLWDLLDDATDRFMGIPKEDRETPDALKAAGEARGLANAIAVMVQPHLADGTAVAKLAVKRFKARQAGSEMPPTPGYMSAEEARATVRVRNEEARVEAKNAAKKVQSERGGAAVPKSSGVLSDREKQSITNLGPTKVGQIKNGIKLGLEDERLAELYNVTVNVIRALAKED